MEYVVNEMNAYLEQNGIMYQCTVPYMPQQNRVAEQADRAWAEIVRSLLIHTKVSFGQKL